MAKRMQEEKGEERIVAVSKPTLNLVTHAATVQSPIASKSPGIFKAPCHRDWKSTGRPVARETQSRRNVEFSSVAKRCNVGREYEETRSGKEEPRTSEMSTKF